MLDSYKNELSLKQYDTRLKKSIFDKNDVYLLSNSINMTSNLINMTATLKKWRLFAVYLPSNLIKITDFDKNVVL